MHSEPTEQEIRDVEQAMKARMTHHALHHHETIGARMAMVLKKNGLLKQSLPDHSMPQVTEALENKTHAARLSASNGGPLLFVQDDDGVSPTKVTDLLITPNKRLRSAAWNHIDSLTGQGILSDATTRVMNVCRGEFHEDRDEAWIPIAIKVHDAIGEDFLCNLAAVRQCLQSSFEAGYTDYLPSVLHPTAESLNSVPPPIWSPSDQRDDLLRERDKCLRALSVRSTLDRYIATLGHVPLTGELSMKSVLRELSGRSHSLWEDVWKWVEETGNPLAQYHACQAFATNTDLVPEKQIPALLEQVCQVLQSMKRPNEDQAVMQGWYLRCELARHYCTHIETLVPGQEGRRVAAWAWWLSNQVASSLPRDPNWIREFRQTTMSAALGLSFELWRLSRAHVQPSTLRYATLFTTSPWAASLLAQLGDSRQVLEWASQDKGTRETITETVFGNLVAMPMPDLAGNRLDYGFEAGMKRVAEEWVTIIDGLEREHLEAIISANAIVSDPSQLSEALQRLTSTSQADVFLAGGAIRAFAICNTTGVDAICTRVEDSSWRNLVFCEASDDAIELFAEALLELQPRVNEEWFYSLPHYFACACELATGERKDTLFTLTVVSSLASDTVSAIQRLMSSEQRKELMQNAANWRKRLLVALTFSPGWLAARLRGVIAVLPTQLQRGSEMPSPATVRQH